MATDAGRNAMRVGLRFVAAAIGLLGLAFVIGGGWLLMLRGSPYYLFAGIGLGISAWLLLRGRASGAWWFWAVLAATFAWTWWESGSNYWRWVPRLGLMVALMLTSFSAMTLFMPFAAGVWKTAEAAPWQSATIANFAQPMSAAVEAFHGTEVLNQIRSQ